MHRGFAGRWVGLAGRSRSLLLLFLCAATAQAAAAQAPTNSSIVDVRILSDRWICVVIDPTPEILSARDAKFGDVLAADRAKHEAKPADDWYYPISAKYHTLLAMADVRPRLISRFEDAAYWSVNGKPPAAATYWPQAIDGFPTRDAGFPAPAEYVELPRVADFVYLRLAEPLHSGERLDIRTADGRSGTLALDERTTPCWSIKVNQVGYRADAAEKFAYLGMWLGAAGPADFAAFDGKPFHVYACERGDRWDKARAVGEPLFTGKVKLRMKEDAQRRRGGDGGDERLSGEDVYEMDFGRFDRPGTYCIVVPGLGRSWPFRIGDDAYGAAFYTVMRALYQQRCGVELKQPFTAWTRKACHTITYRGGFPPETDRWYENEKYDPTGKFGFRDESGKPISVSSFAAVGATITKETVPVTGGWHDAADFDRRIYHYSIVWDLCGLYEMFPARFTDGQLNLPESGNGIPDLLDEAAVQVDFFRKTQTPDGGVSGWVEQNRHPSHETAPERDTNLFSTSLPEHGASYAYAAAAAYLARLIEPFDAPRAKEYVASAARAYRWASDPAHSIRGVKFEIPSPGGGDGKRITVLFDQSPDLPGTQGSKTNPHFMLAAMQLYAATHDRAYLKDWEEHQGVKEVLLRGQPDAVHPFAFVTPCLHSEWFGKEAAEQLIVAARREADVLCEGQQRLAYRTLWYPPTHGYFPLMSWGNIHAGHAAHYPIVCWRLTGDAKYRQAVLLALDWELGCNEVGRSLVTGLGSTHPTCLQHITSERDEWLEPVPGIVPYAFTYGIAYPAWQTQLALIDPGHGSVKSFFPGAAVCLLPTEWDRAKVQSDLDRLPRTGDSWPPAAIDRLRPAVEPRFPLMHRTYIHPTLSPPQNEFTVNETISPLAAACGAMLSDGWMPTQALKKRKPRTDAASLPIYLQS